MNAAKVQTPQFAGMRFRGAESKKPNPFAVNIWLMKAHAEAIGYEATVDFDMAAIGHGFRRKMAKLSLCSDGSRRAFDKPGAVGVTAVYVPRLKKTHIDGTCPVESQPSSLACVTTD